MISSIWRKFKQFFGESPQETVEEHVDAQKNKPWIYLGNCPACKEGLVRVRASGSAGARKLYALCDECEAYWLEPDISREPRFPDPENQICPVTGGDMFGEQSSWATEAEVAGSEWQEKVTIEP